MGKNEIARGRLATVCAKDTTQRCAFVVIADGFEEVETVVALSLLRQAGLCAKSVGLTSGLVGGAHGVWLMPDLTLADLDDPVTPVNAVILPEGKRCLTRLEADPRVHRLLRRAVAQRGHIATGSEGLRVSRAAAVWGNKPGTGEESMPLLLRQPKQSLEAFVWDLIRRLKQPPRT